MLKALGVATMLAIGVSVAAPAQATVAETPATVASYVATASPDAVVTFESPTVATVAAETVGETVAVTEPEQTPVEVVEPAPATPTPEGPSDGDVEIISTPPVVSEEPAVPEVTEPVVTEPVTPEVPVVEVPAEPTPEPETLVIHVSGEQFADSEFAPETIEGLAGALEGETYTGAFYGTSPAPYEGTGKRVGVSSVTATADGNPLSGNVLNIFYVYTTAS